MRLYEDTRYINIRRLFGLTIDEAESWQLVLARAMNQFNSRRFLGIRVYKKSNKPCVWNSLRLANEPCDKTIDIGLIFKYRNKHYSILLCKEHFNQLIDNMYNDLADKVSNFIVSLKAYVERLSSE